MTNDQMKAGRFLRWHKARKKIEAIKSALNAGQTVYVCTPLRAVKYAPKHADMFRATKTGAYVQRGKSWDCIDFTAIKIAA